MQRVTFGKFLENTTAYERMSVSVHPGLRRGVWLSEVLICVCVMIYQYLPSGDFARNTLFFLWKNDWLARTWDFTAAYRQPLILTCVVVFVTTLGLIVPTRFYQKAEISWHAALFVPVIFATINLLFVAILLAPLITNLVLWFFLIFACIVTGSILLMIFFRILAR